MKFAEQISYIILYYYHIILLSYYIIITFHSHRIELQQSRSRELHTWRSEERSASSVVPSVEPITRVWIRRLLRQGYNGSTTDGASRQTSPTESPSRGSALVKH